MPSPTLPSPNPQYRFWLKTFILQIGFGEGFSRVRTDVGTVSETDFGYTGQRALGDLGFMDYHARFYDAYLNQWAQPDTIIPDPSNPQSLNRYSYALNNPIRYNDPSGNRNCDEDGYCPGDKDKGWLTPGELLHRDHNLPSCQGDLMPECIQRQNDLSNNIDIYMRHHPEYQPYNDPLIYKTDHPYRPLVFVGIRMEYWMKRTNGNQAEAERLMEYYDFHEHVMIPKWDGSRVNWTNTALDGSSTVLSFIALNEVAEALKIASNMQSAAKYGAAITNVVSIFQSAKAQDGTGFGLSIGGAVPGLIGTGFSAVSTLRDVSAGFYYEPWTPIMPR